MPVDGGCKGKSGTEPTLEINLVQPYLDVRVFGSHEILIFNFIIKIGNNINCMTT